MRAVKSHGFILETRALASRSSCEPAEMVREEPHRASPALGLVLVRPEHTRLVAAARRAVVDVDMRDHADIRPGEVQGAGVVTGSVKRPMPHLGLTDYPSWSLGWRLGQRWSS